jgi:hypothetical protein
MHTAEEVSHLSSLVALVDKAGSEENFEALYAVDAIDRMNLDGQLLLADKINIENIWAHGTAVAAANSANAMHAP